MAKTADNTNELKGVEKSIRDSIGRAFDKDTSKLYGALADDPEFFIFHPDSKSTIIGFDSFKEMVEKTFLNEKFKATGFDLLSCRN